MVKENYRGYLISGLAVPVTETDDEWFSPCGYVYRVEPNGRAVEVGHLESKGIFKLQQSAEERALRLCRQWIDAQTGSEPH